MLRENLSVIGGNTRMVTLTAPGSDVLPWDLEYCAWRGDHHHSGPSGCRVDREALNRWHYDRRPRWHRLNMAARDLARVHEPVIAALCWEVQDRGALHVHLVVVANDAGERFVEALFALAERHGFGSVRDEGYSAKGAYAHAHYLSKYLTKHDERTETGRREIAYGADLLPRQRVWVSPVLTRRTGATMRVLRLQRSLWAYAEGLREAPPRMPDGVVEAWVLYWRRVGRRGRENVPRSVSVRDYGRFEPWGALSWPGELWESLNADRSATLTGSSSGSV